MKNREIKFRVWKESKSEWIYPTRLITRSFEKTLDRDLIFMQYTGMKDRSGTEIYEKDILRCPTDDYLYGDKSVVEFHAGRFHLTILYDLTPISLCEYDTVWQVNGFSGDKDTARWLSEFEVIGNIFEDKELLE